MERLPYLLLLDSSKALSCYSYYLGCVWLEGKCFTSKIFSLLIFWCLINLDKFNIRRKPLICFKKD